MRKLLFLSTMLVTVAAFSQSIGIDLNQEQEIYKATKQVNQFFRRFNAEETPKGERVYEGDPTYHNPEYRKKFLEILIDPLIDKSQKSEFINTLTKKTAFYLDFHKGAWFAEVKAQFLYRGKPDIFILFLTVQEENIGSKWVINNIYNQSLYKLFDVDTQAWNKFIHPMSHELDFMNLAKVFKEGTIIPYLNREFKPDFLSILVYEHMLGNLKFDSVKEVKFHFFQMPEWYFGINNLYRDKDHTGWLITRIMKMSEEEKQTYEQLILLDKDL